MIIHSLTSESLPEPSIDKHKQWRPVQQLNITKDTLDPNPFSMGSKRVPRI